MKIDTDDFPEGLIKTQNKFSWYIGDVLAFYHMLYAVAYDAMTTNSAGLRWINLNGTSSPAHPLQDLVDTVLSGVKSKFIGAWFPIAIKWWWFGNKVALCGW